jgi:hypothetical protein
MMDRTHDELPSADARGDPATQGEADIRAMLERSTRDIVAGRVAPLAPVLEGMRAKASQIRDERSGRGKAGRRPG